MGKFTLTGINFDGSPLLLHFEARDAEHAKGLISALPLGKHWLLVVGHVQSADGHTAVTMLDWMAANGGVNSFNSTKVQEYLAWYNDPARLFSPVLTRQQCQELGRIGQEAGFPLARLLDEGSHYTALYTAEPTSRIYSDRILGLLRPGDNVWQVCLYRPKAYLEQFGTTDVGYRVVSQHATPEQAFKALLATVGYESDFMRSTNMATI